MSNMLSEGEIAPDFSLTGDDYEDVMLSQFRGQNIVLFFYPKDDTPGCTQEAKDFRDLSEEFEAVNTVILGMSKDSAEDHESFKEKYELPFCLISDEEAMALEDYGVWVEKNMYGKKYMGTQRSTFLIDKNGKIKKIWRKVKVQGHAAEVLEEAKKLG